MPTTPMLVSGYVDDSVRPFGVYLEKNDFAKIYSARRPSDRRWPSCPGCETAGAPTIAGAGSKDLNAEEKAGAAAGGIPSTALARPWCVRISDPIPSIGSELSSGGALRIIEEYADQLREIIKKLRRRPH